MNGLALIDWVRHHARRAPGSPAVDSPSERLTYGDLASRAASLSASLRRAGLVRGDRVVCALPAGPAAVVVTCALQDFGAIDVEVHREWTAGALGAAVVETEARGIAIAARDAPRWAPVLARCSVHTVVAVHDAAAPIAMAKDPSLSWIPLDEGGSQLAGEAPADPAGHVHAPGDLAALLYTSGTAGRPRAVMQTFGNIEHNTRAIVASLGLTPRDRALLGLPLSYCYGRSVLQTHLLLGASVFVESRTSYPTALLQTIGAERCTGLAGVPLTFELLRRQTRPDPRAMPSLRYLTQAGGAMAPETATWVREAFHPARLFQMYGQTEATARLTCLPPEMAADRSGSVGVALPGVEVRVVDDHGREARRGETGHVVARGPSVTPGYYRAPEETARVLRGGWLWTGDLGRMDEDGYLFLCGRTKEILKIAGHRVAPEEIEAALAQHPAVVEAAAIGVSHPLMGEVAAVLVVAAPGSRLTEAELRRHCAARLPPYGVPRVYRFAPELPRNAAGKVERARVAASLRPAAGST